jgi:signal transduction histidine kinase
MTILDNAKIGSLPHWARVAFIARCARRLLEYYASDEAEPAEQRAIVAKAVALAESRAAVGGSANDSAFEYEHLTSSVGEVTDNYDLDSLCSSIAGVVRAASNTYDDVGADAGPVYGAVSLAQCAFVAAFGKEVQDDPSDPRELVEQSAEWLLFVNPSLKSDVHRDFDTLVRVFSSEQWTAESGVTPSIFGELWPDGLPPGAGPRLLGFRPRARIVRTIGDQLISGPDAAVIELIKNSHDADASIVRITFIPPLHRGEGLIVVEDDGHGMTFADIENKWMEPATGDKRDRRFSPGGRRLLGSKGIGRFAASRLGRYLQLRSTAPRASSLGNDGDPSDADRFTTTKIEEIDWDLFERTDYLDQIRFPATSILSNGPSGTVLRISVLRDEWTEKALRDLHGELRRVVSPVSSDESQKFRIFLDLSQCTADSCGFDGGAVVNGGVGTTESEVAVNSVPHEVQPFPVLDASDYTVDGVFDEDGHFEGTMTIGRAGQEPEAIHLIVPLNELEGEGPCGVVLVRLHIFDREGDAVRNTAVRAGFGQVGVREARKLLDRISGVSIYRGGFRVRPYGDSENDWLTLDAKRVQNPSVRIGRNQISGIVTVDDEASSRLVERSSREGLEENGAFRRLQSIMSVLLAEIVEPRRREFRIRAGLEERKETSFQDIYRQVQMSWSKMLLAKVPAPDRAEVEALIAEESDKLTAYLKRLEARQAQLEAQVTLGLIVGEVMHQGNTPLSFLETEADRLTRWWPSLLNNTPEAIEDRGEVSRILRGMNSSSAKLRALFNALSPLSGARRGPPRAYDPRAILESTKHLFETRLAQIGISFEIKPEGADVTAFGYRDDLATAVTNLIDNGIYWLQHRAVPRPLIAVSIKANDGRCLIRIEDNGGGIPDEFVDQIFDVGFTLKPHGTGLGLSIAREAIQRSGGELRLIPSGDGAVFEINLPSGGSDLSN